MKCVAIPRLDFRLIVPGESIFEPTHEQRAPQLTEKQRHPESTLKQRAHD